MALEIDLLPQQVQPKGRDEKYFITENVGSHRLKQPGSFET